MIDCYALGFQFCIDTLLIYDDSEYTLRILAVAHGFDDTKHRYFDNVVLQDYFEKNVNFIEIAKSLYDKFNQKVNQKD